MKIKGSRLLGWSLRHLGSANCEGLMDLWFLKDSYRFWAVETKEGLYDIKGGAFRHGELLAAAPAEKTKETANTVSYKQLLGSYVYDEEGSILGSIGDVEIDCDDLRLIAVDLSGGIISDLAFGRIRVSAEHLKDMLVEVETEK